MILNNNVTNDDIKIVGDVTSNKVSIDAKNIDFITQILSTNLYSNPIESFLREAISNADDSHIEAGTKQPIILDIGKLSGKYYIRIQDFGTGISREKFNAIYRYIGSSTKREDNKYTGAFGLGKFAALAVSDSVIITSICDGNKTQYLMYKNNLSIQIDEISSVSTTEENGVEILVYVSDTTYNQLSRSSVLLKLVFFDNLFVVCNTYNSLNVEAFNKRKLYNFKYFSIFNCDCHRYSSCTSSLHIKYGKVIYPLDTSKLGFDSRDWRADLPIALNIPIGELDVTPNRESLLYSQKTIHNLLAYLNNAIDELKSELKKQFDIELTADNAIELVFNRYLYSMIPVSSSSKHLIDFCGISVNVPSSFAKTLYENLKYKDKRLGENIFDIYHLVERVDFNVVLAKRGRSVHITKPSANNSEENLQYILSKMGKDTVYLLWSEPVKGSTRNYLEDKYTGKNVFVVSLNKRRTKEHFYKYLLTNPSGKPKEEKKENIRIFVELIQDIFKKNIPVLKNESTPEEYLEKKEKTIAKTAENTRLFYRNEKYSDNWRVLGSLKEYTTSGHDNTIFIYCTQDTETFVPFIFGFDKAVFKKYFKQKFNKDIEIIRVVKVSKPAVSLISSLPNWIDVVSMVAGNNSGWLLNVKQARKLKDEFQSSKFLNGGMSPAIRGFLQLSEELKNAADKLFNTETFMKLYSIDAFTMDVSTMYQNITGNYKNEELKTYAEFSNVKQEDFDTLEALSNITELGLTGFVFDYLGYKIPPMLQDQVSYIKQLNLTKNA